MRKVLVSRPEVVRSPPSPSARPPRGGGFPKVPAALLAAKESGTARLFQEGPRSVRSIGPIDLLGARSKDVPRSQEFLRHRKGIKCAGLRYVGAGPTGGRRNHR